MGWSDELLVTDTPFRVGTHMCDRNMVNEKKPFTNNARYIVKRGRQYINDGVIDFGETFQKPELAYRTLFYANFMHDAIIYADNDTNLSIAMQYRAFACRGETQVPYTVLGWDQHLEDQQATCVARHQEKFNEHYRQNIDVYDGYLGSHLEAELHVSDPHPKKVPREEAMAEIKNLGLDGHKIWTDPGRRTVAAKFKKDEWAKPGKAGRAIIDVGINASLQGFRLAMRLKAIQSIPMNLVHGTSVFCKEASTKTVAKHFENALNPTKTYYYTYSSDDGMFSVKTRRLGVQPFNLDISACDQSQLQTYQLAYNLTPPCFHKDIDCLVEQCKQPIQIRSRTKKRDKKVIVQFVNPDGTPAFREFSGSVFFTTPNNNLAQMLITCELDEQPWDEAESIDDLKRMIRDAYYRAGFLVSIEHCDDFHKLQFLKMSPVIDTQKRLRALLNPGVLMRASGVCRGDLPGRGPLIKRAEAFQQSLLTGMYSRVNFNLIAAMRDRVKHAKPTKKITDTINNLLLHKAHHDDEQFEVSDTEVYARYELSDAEIAELNHCGRNAGYGTRIHSKAAAKIIKADYGYGHKKTPEGIDHSYPRLFALN